MQVSSVVIASIPFLFHPHIYSSTTAFLYAVNMANEANYNATNHLTHEPSPPIEKDFNHGK